MIFTQLYNQSSVYFSRYAWFSGSNANKIKRISNTDTGATNNFRNDFVGIASDNHEIP